MIDAPNENLFRGRHTAPTLRAEGEGSDGTLMYGHFSQFDTWYEIDSWFEGRFLERTAQGAFKKTIRENRDSMKVQFDHGYDFNIGDALLGPIDDLREDEVGPYYEVPLLDTDYNRDRVLPQLSTALMNGDVRGTSLLGSSFRFRVTRDEWVVPDKATDLNPEKLPERTIREVRVMEFGPVVWPANDEATAGVRSLSDHYHAKEIARRGAAERAARDLGMILPHAEHGSPAAPTVTPPTGAPDGTRDGLMLASARTRILSLR